MIIEDSPDKILSKFDTSNLDEAILKACSQRMSVTLVTQTTLDPSEIENKMLAVIRDEKEDFFRWRIMKQLMLKNYLTVKRSPL